MSVEDNQDRPTAHYFERPLSVATSFETAQKPDTFGRLPASPRQIQEAVFQPPKKPVARVFYVDDKGVRPYQENTWVPRTSRPEDVPDGETSGNQKFKSAERQIKRQRNQRNNSS